MDENKYILKTISTKCILIYIATTLVAVPIIYMTIIKMSNTDENNYLVQSIITLVSYLALAVTFCIMLRKYLFDDIKELKNKWWFKLLLVIGLIVAIKLMEWFCGWFYSLFGETINGNNQDAVVNNIKENAVLMAFSTCIFAPIVEEIIFRKCIFSYFLKDIYAILVSTFAFGLIHVIGTLDFIHILPYLFTGALFSIFYSLSKRNIYVPLLAHMVVNTISFVLICIN